MERLLFFPQPFPDESLYSLAVRYHRLSANESYRRTSQELFGAYSRTCGSILPCCLDALSQAIASAYSVAELIKRFTLLPLYEPFLGDSRYTAACSAMAGSNGTGLKMSLGITASGFLKHASLKYCEKCIERDVLTSGVAYWHRTHQSPGTCVCPHHAEVLRAVKLSGQGDWRCMVLPAEEEAVVVMDPSNRAAVNTISEMQFWGLNHPSQVKKLLKGDFVRDHLNMLGLVSSGRIKEQAFKGFLSTRLQCLPDAAEFQEIADSCEWVFRILRPRGSVLQPLKFYTLCWLIELDVEDLKSFLPRTEIFVANKARNESHLLNGEQEIEQRRAAFASAQTVKCRNKPGYQWLYRHDRAWLMQYVASHPIIRIRKNLIDWVARDVLLAQEILTARNRLLSLQSKPKKITRAVLSRGAVHGHDFLRKPDKFPITTALLGDMLESDHDHQVRKLRWAVRHYLLSERTAISVVFRYAGIRVPYVTQEEVLNILSTA